MNDILTNLYNNSMILAQQNNLDDTQKSIIIDSIGALLQAVNVTDFYGTYSLEQLKKDIERCI